MFMFIVISVVYGKLQKGKTETDDEFNKRKIKQVEGINPFYYTVISLLVLSVVIFYIFSK